MKLDLLDELIVLGHGSKRSLDCIMAVDVTRELSDEEVLSGIRRAQARFPKTSSHDVPIIREFDLEIFSGSLLRSHEHLELALLELEGKNYVALKMSHVLGDAVSMLLWLKCFMGEEVANGPLELKSFPPKKDTPYRKFFNSLAWPDVKGKSARRRISRATLHHPGIDCSILNDLFLLALLETIPGENKAIWLPVNVRKYFWQGFGNGLSRMRIYPPKGQTLEEKLKYIRIQKKEAMQSGEVALPPVGFKLDSRLQKIGYQLWVNRPWADWGSIGFSHIVDRDEDFPFDEVWGVSNIMPRHSAAIFAFTKESRTFLTLTSDISVPETSALSLISTFEQKIQKIRTELDHG